MGPIQLVLQLLLPLIIIVHKTDAQLPEDSDCAYVRNFFFNVENEQRADRFFQVLRNLESGGNICEVIEDKIGPYQLSEEYYDVAVTFNERLSAGGFDLAIYNYCYS